MVKTALTIALLVLGTPTLTTVFASQLVQVDGELLLVPILALAA